MKTLKLKLISLIAMVCLVLGLVVVGIYAAEIQYIKLGGNITFNVDDKSLYVQDVRMQEDMNSSTTPYSLKEKGKFMPGYINEEFNMNLGTYNNTYGGIIVYFDIINTVDESGISYIYDVSASTTQIEGEIKVQAVVDNEDGYIPYGSITPSEITSTTSPTATVILTITSSQGVEVDLSQITITITRREPVEITDFTFSLSDDYTASVTGYAGSDTTVTIPSSISVVETADGTKYYEGSQYTVTSIADGYYSGGYHGVFLNNTTITQVVFPDTLQTIGNNAFQGCSGLTQIVFPDTLQTIGNNAFRGCSGLSQVVFPDTLQTIGNNAFQGCSGLAQIVFPDTLQTIGSYAFQNCSNIATLEYKGSLEQYLSIDMRSGWMSDSSHTLIIDGQEITGELIIPSVISIIPANSFYGCTDINSIQLTNNVTSIKWEAFRRCTMLTEITIPESITNISYGAFLDCNIRSVNYQGVIEQWLALEHSQRENGNSISPGPWINSGYNLIINDEILPENLILPNGLTEIKTGTFCGLNVVNILIPNSVKSIGMGAFYGCRSLTSISIPASVTSIGYGAFSNTGLTTVTIESETIYNLATSTSACGYLLNYATTVRVHESAYDGTNSYLAENFEMNIDGEYYVFNYVFTR